LGNGGFQQDLHGCSGDRVGAHLAENGLLYFSTLLHPYPSNDNVLDSWYIAPRNGHISIFTFQAIAVLFRHVGSNVVQSLYSLIGLRNPTKFPNLLFVWPATARRHPKVIFGTNQLTVTPHFLERQLHKSPVRRYHRHKSKH
jgi:hypothetical protein